MKKYPWILGTMLAMIILTVSMVYTGPMSASEGVIEISRQEVGQMAVDNSRMVADLETSRNDLLVQFTDMNNMTDGLKTLYDQLSTYQGLYNWYQGMAAIPNYHTYLDLAVNPATAGQAALMRDGIDNGGLTVLEETALNDALNNPANMPVNQYGFYLALKPGYDAMGLTDPNISREKEYNTFVYPIKVAPLALQNGVLSLSRSLDIAKKSIASGSESLYDALLQLDGVLDIMETSYTTAEYDFASASSRHQVGMISDISYKTEKNDRSIAYLNYRTMGRQVKDLKMNLNVMLGQDVTANLQLTHPKLEDYTIEPLQTIEFYIDKALEERNELITNNESTYLKKTEFDLIDDFFSSTSNTYKIAELELQQLLNKKESLELSIEEEIRNAYFDLTLKEEALRLKKIKLDDAKRQYNDFLLNVELGLVTEAMLGNLDLLVISSQNDYNSATVAYIGAYEAFMGATTLGPAYIGSQGGMSFE